MGPGRRRRWSAVLVAAVLLPLVLAGCSGTTKPSRSFPTRPTTGTATLLERPPSYSGPGASDWARDYTPSTEQFLDQFYAVKVHDKIRGELRKQGLAEIVHALWITDNQIQNDIVLLRFTSSDGAAARLGFARDTNSGNGELRTYTLDSPHQPVVFYTDRPVNKGFVQAKGYAQVGVYVVEMFTYAPNTVPRQQIDRWLTEQVRLLDQ